MGSLETKRTALQKHLEELKQFEREYRTRLTYADLVLCEGFKTTDLPKIEVFRRAAHDAPLFEPSLPNASAWQAMVSDGPVDGLPFPLFRFDQDGWLDQLADWVEQNYLPNRG